MARENAVLPGVEDGPQTLDSFTPPDDDARDELQRLAHIHGVDATLSNAEIRERLPEGVEHP